MVKSTITLSGNCGSVSRVGEDQEIGLSVINFIHIRILPNRGRARQRAMAYSPLFIRRVFCGNVAMGPIQRGSI